MVREGKGYKSLDSDFCRHGKRAECRDHGRNVQMPSKERWNKIRGTKTVNPYKSACIPTNPTPIGPDKTAKEQITSVTMLKWSTGTTGKVWKGAAEGIPPDKTAPVILFIILSIHGICGL
jgi:hypothetical protein